MPVTKFTDKLFDEICDEIAHTDKGLVFICKSKGINAKTFYEWIKEKEDLRNKYAHARELQAEYLADQIIEIADFTEKDTIHVDSEAGGYDVPNHEWISRSRLRVDARKWAASKLYPKKYGDKTDITSGGNEIKSVNLGELVQTFMNERNEKAG